MKKKQINKNPIFIISVVLLLFAIGLALLDVYVNKANPFDYIGGIITEIIGIIITLLFVQWIFDKKEIKDEKQDEINRIVKFHKLLNKYIQEYTLYFNCVTTPIEKRKSFETELNPNFSFSDMQDLYGLTLSLRNSVNQSSIRCFYQYEQAVKNYMIEILTHNDFKYYPEIENIFSSYINISINGDYHNFILSVDRNKEFVNCVVDIIKNDTDNFIAKFNEQDPHALNSIAVPYYILYNVLEQERDVIVQYNNLISSIIET